MRLTFVADDPETTPNVNDGNNATLLWTLAGTDADDFEIEDDPDIGGDDPGILRFKDGPDFEAPTDSGRNNVYEVTVQVADKAGNTASQRVKITVENVDEAGGINVLHTVPEEGARLVATLTDADRARGIRWQWYRAVTNTADLPETSCTDALNVNCLISRATSSSYTPRAYPDDRTDDDGTAMDNTDVGQTLTVVATYDDGHDRGKSEFETITTSVRAKQDPNADPAFSSATAIVEVRENATPRAVGEVGDPNTALLVTATDANNDTLNYSLSAGDTSFFTIDQNGQISVAAGVELDYETKKSYTVTVRAVDPSGRSDTIRVTINVVNVDETPELTRKGLVAVGRGSISYPENGRDRVAEYSALGPSAGSVRWSLSGRDASDFSISSRGALTFRSTPNFESPADADRDNRYELTVTARSGREQDEFDVTVDVYNVDEEGQVTVTPARGNIGTRLSAEVTDPDGAVTGVSWEWARSENGETGWTPVPGTNSDRYIIEAEDRGFFLQATAYYSDPEGGGKSASGRTGGPVLRDDDGRVTLTPAEAQAGDRVTAALTDPDGNIRNTTWQWERSESRTSGWSEIPGATQSTYTTGTLDVGNFLRVTVRYDDGDGWTKSQKR